MSFSPHRRSDDNRRTYRDFWLLLISGLVALALANAQDALDRQQEGRKVALTVSCAVLSSVSEAGRQVIVRGSEQPDSPFMRFLEQHGYPRLAAREKAGQMAAEAYVAGISARIERSVGHRGDGLVNRDGTVNCVRLVGIPQIHH